MVPLHTRMPTVGYRTPGFPLHVSTASASRLLVTLLVTPVTTLVSVGVIVSRPVYPVLVMRSTRSGLLGLGAMLVAVLG